jgi:4-amino-4-deoxy-L-arabinose transferase-like glycosyltransferase/lipopolysaccharide biosynthesis regulator YciM
MEDSIIGIRRERFFLLIVIAVSILFRAIYIWQYHSSVYWGSLTVDARYHYLWAQAIASGDFWGSQVFFRAPFYAYFLALLYKIFSGSILAIVIVQNLIGIISYVLVYKLVRELFGVQPAMIAAVLYLFTFDFYFFESELLLDFLLVFFLPLIFLIIFRAERIGRSILWLPAGLVLGLATATRPTVLILLALIPLFFLRPKSKLFAVKKWFLSTVLFIAGVVAILLPIAIRNYAVAGEFTFVPTQGGINFYIGNNSQANGWSAAMPDSLGGAFWQYAECKQIAEKETGKDLNPGQVSRFWFKKGFTSLSKSPGHAALLYLNKIALLFTNQEISNNRNIPQFRDKISISYIMPISWWLIFPFGIVGMIACLKRNFKAKMVLLFMILYSAVILVFFITSRFRLPLLSFWIAFASCGILFYINLFADRGFRDIILYSLLIAAAMAFSLINFQKIDFSNPLQEEYVQGNRYIRQGSYREAVATYHNLLSQNPGYPQANMNMAAAFVRLGELDSAAFYYKRELNLNPKSALSLSSLAEISRIDGDSMQAYDYAQKAIDLKPYFVEILINYVKAARGVSQQKAALEEIKPLIKYYRSNPYYFLYRGILEIDLAATNVALLDSAGADFEKAIEYFQRESQPSYDRDPATLAMLFSKSRREDMLAIAYANLGVISLNKSDNDRALQAFTQALEYDSSMYQAQRGLLEAYIRTGAFDEVLKLTKGLLERAPQSERPSLLLYRAQAYYNLGNKAEAIRVLEQLLNEFPDYQPARRILEAIKTGG